MNNSDNFNFLIKFIALILGFGIFTHLIASFIEELKIFVAPIDLIFIIYMVYNNREKFNDIIATLEN